jgi:hypothetical protein
VHSSSQDQRRQKRLVRELQASSTVLETTGYCWRTPIYWFIRI